MRRTASYFAHMTNIPFTQIDAFASKPFEGNQACVMPLDAYLPDGTLQKIAAENNVAETAFIVPDGDARWHLRWFTPAIEVPLCGHATLASAHYLYHHQGFGGEKITFQTRKSGELYVSQLADGRLEMDFPAPRVRQIEITDDVVAALGARPKEAWGGPFYAAIYETPEEVRGLKPDFRSLADLGVADEWDRGNFGCLAAGGDNGANVTSRFFAPGSGIDEDPATGSWHCMLSAIMSPKLGEVVLKNYQAFPARGAWIETELTGDRVKLRGQAVTVIQGVFLL